MTCKAVVTVNIIDITSSAATDRMMIMMTMMEIMIIMKNIIIIVILMLALIIINIQCKNQDHVHKALAKNTHKSGRWPHPNNIKRRGREELECCCCRGCRFKRSCRRRSSGTVSCPAQHKS